MKMVYFNYVITSKSALFDILILFEYYDVLMVLYMVLI
jgi:hypothetical protein